MPLPSFSRLVAYVTGLKAEQVNWAYDEIEKIALATLLADYHNAETISTTKTLTNADAPIQRLTPSGADRTVNLPTVAATNHPFFIVNASSTYSLIVGTLEIISPGQSALFVSDGVAWANTKRTENGYIAEQGGKLVYVGAAAYNVTPGSMVVNGQLLRWTANISRTSLSLSASTLYYVYLYSNSGTPAVEESTVAPAWNSTLEYCSKPGDNTRRCIGWILTNGSANIRKFTMTVSGRVAEIIYTDGESVGGSAKELVAAGASTGSWTSFSLLSRVPSHATHWYCAPKLSVPTVGDDTILGISPIDLSTATAGDAPFTIRGQGSVTNARIFTGRAWLPIENANENYYRINRIAGTTGTAYIEVHGARIVR